MESGRKRRAETEQKQHHQRQSEEQVEDVEVPELPPEVIVDILSRLPVKSVFICRRVCKLWLSLISGSDFAKIHLSRSQVSFLVKVMGGNPRNVQLIDLEIAPFVGSSKATMKLTPTNNLPVHSKKRKRNNLPGDIKIALNILNSCNGLLCMCDPMTDDPIYVSNPILGEYITLPKCDSEVKCSLYSSAFGFSPKTNQYKVVRSFRRRVLDPVTCKLTYGEYELEIYTLGEGSWRSKGESSQTICNCNSFNAFLNGAIHWLDFSTEQPGIICCFDFATEHFRRVPEPSEFIPTDKDLFGDINFGVLHDCLSIRYFTEMERIDIWVMKDYGVKESWIKHLVIHNLIYMSWRDVDFYEPVMILESGQILFLFGRDILYLYDPESDEYRKVYRHQRGSYFVGIAHIPSLVSLRDVARGENLKMCST